MSFIVGVLASLAWPFVVVFLAYWVVRFGIVLGMAFWPVRR